jgi:serine/threonine protein kinase
MPTAMESAEVPGIGKYHLIAELARGGMGIVHLAASHGPGGFQKLLVVKELKPELCQDDSYVAMFLDEARLAARLQHRNIVQTIEVGSEGERHYMVMEFLDGRSLSRIAHRFADRATFPLGAHLRILAEALQGLHYAHELRDFDGEPLGIVHRDVSPLNVLVTFDGQVKVIDFGIAKSIDSTLETKTGVLKGRIAYMAPEQAWGQPVDRRADVYSAGVMIWEAAAGRRLWPGKNEVEILATMLREGPPSPRTVRPDVPARLEDICMRALAREPRQRHGSAAELQEDLESYLGTRSDAMSMRDVGGLVSAVFAEERRRTSALIDETISRVRGSGHRSGVMLALEGHTRGTPSGRSRVLPTPGSILGSLQASAAGVAPRVASPLDRVREWTRRRAVLAGSLAGGLVLLVVILAAALGQSEPTTTADGGPAGVVREPIAPRTLGDVPILGTAAPVEATPVRWFVPRTTAHQGRRSGSSDSMPDVPAAPAPAAPPPPPASDVGPAPGQRPLRPIITSNPYGTP